jgi:hypothetical protein
MLGIMLWFAWMVLEVVIVVAMIRWGYETGQWKHLKDMEDPKYRMLVDRPLEGWPGREKKAGSDEAAKIAVRERGG